MKVLVCLFTLMSSIAAFAAPSLPVPAEGTYAFAGRFAVTINVRYETVYGFTDAGQAELAKRLPAGDECANTGRDIYLCKSFGSLEGAPGLIATRVARALEGKTLTLGKMRGEPALISHGDLVSEYQVPQAATFAGESYDSYRLVRAQGNWSIRFGTPTKAQFNLDGGRVSMPLDVPYSRSREEYSIYGVAAELAVR
jgi:hypothetical protein